MSEPQLAIRADYRVMWIDGLALAAEQIPDTDFFTGTGMNSDGDVLFHGLYLGLDWSF